VSRIDGSASDKEHNIDYSHHDDERVQLRQVHRAARRGRFTIQGDQISILFFSFKVLCNHISRTRMGTAINRSV